MATAANKTTTLRITPGMVLRTSPVGGIQHTKTGAVDRTVASTERIPASDGYRQTRFLVTFTDGTFSKQAPSTTWTLGTPAPVEAPVTEHLAAKVAKAPSACLHCNLPTQGGNYLPGHDAKHVSVLVAEIRNGRDAKEALVELSGSPRLEAKALQVLAKLGLHPGA